LIEIVQQLSSSKSENVLLAVRIISCLFVVHDAREMILNQSIFLFSSFSSFFL